MAYRMIVMSESEFRMFVQDWVGLLSKAERENAEVLHRALCELFFETCELHNTQGIIVWKGNMGRYPTELIWIEDSETFIEHALKEADLTEEVSGHGEAVH
jgi:hypothetical protein